MTKPKWYDEHISMGSLINLGVLLIAIATTFAVSQYRIQDNSERLEKMENLQITMAEVLLRQQNFVERTERMETSAERAHASIESSLTDLRKRIRDLEMGRIRRNSDDGAGNQ